MLIRGGRIYAASTNSKKEGVLTDPLYKNKQTHAELALLCKLDPAIIEGSVLYVSGWTRSGKSRVMSKPCERCQEYIKRFNLKAVYYSLSDGSYEKMS